MPAAALTRWNQLQREELHQLLDYREARRKTRIYLAGLSEADLRAFARRYQRLAGLNFSEALKYMRLLRRAARQQLKTRNQRRPR